MVNPTSKQYITAYFDIIYTVLHNVILMEVPAYTMKFVAGMKRKSQQERKVLKARSDEIHNSEDPNDEKELDELKKRVENMIDKEDEEAARKTMAKY